MHKIRLLIPKTSVLRVIMVLRGKVKLLDYIKILNIYEKMHYNTDIYVITKIFLEDIYY
jgi:hypothetical protein